MLWDSRPCGRFWVARLESRLSRAERRQCSRWSAVGCWNISFLKSFSQSKVSRCWNVFEVWLTVEWTAASFKLIRSFFKVRPRLTGSIRKSTANLAFWAVSWNEIYVAKMAATLKISWIQGTSQQKRKHILKEVKDPWFYFRSHIYDYI
jgi:hypothetical protein